MRNFIKLVIVLAISAGGGIWAYQNLPNHYFIEAYYEVQNLDPNNEKNAEVLRQYVHQLIQKNIPSRYRPNPDHFQCFKIISEAVFFCSADTFRKKEAEYVRNLLLETIPNEIGWIPLDEAEQKSQSLKSEIASTKKEIAQHSEQLEKLIRQQKKNSAEEKKFIKVNDLYKKTRDLYDKKIELLETMIGNLGNADLKKSYEIRMEQTQLEKERFEEDYTVFQSKHKPFVETAQKRDSLQDELANLQTLSDKQQKDLSFVEQTLMSPNAIGKVANVEELQLIPQPSRQKFEILYRQSNLLWFSLVLFLLLSNFVLRIQSVDLIAFEDATRTEALIK